MKRIATIVLLGLGGLVAATSLTLGALALAGDDVGSVVHPQLDGSRDRPTHSPSASGAKSPEPSPGADPSSTHSATPSDGGGSSEPDPGDEDESDSSGSGSGGSEDHFGDDD